jgi:hypothetical protein
MIIFARGFTGNHAEGTHASECGFHLLIVVEALLDSTVCLLE